MSQVLKAMVPAGTLGYDRWPITGPSPAEKRREELVAQGSKMRGLMDAADGLLNAATRLGTEIRKETKYWDGVLSVADEGWSVTRAGGRTASHELGVRFGVAECTLAIGNIHRNR